MVYCYQNADNTCGQAAIATMVDFYGKNPWNLPRSANGHWDDATVINRIYGDGHHDNVSIAGTDHDGPTMPKTIVAALRDYGIAADEVTVETGVGKITGRK